MKKKLWAMALTVIIGASLVFQQMHVQAVTSTSDTSVRSVHVLNSEIEESTLVIGSYLIHINGLSDEIYSLAQDSASEFAQNKMYYKSELASGKWYEITDATSIADITTGGNPVDASVIEALEFTHKVDADGTITDLRTGQTVASYDVSDPYNLEDLDELEQVKLNYDSLREKETKTDSDNKNIEIIKKLFELDIKDSVTEDYDAKLSALETYRNGLKERGKPDTWVTEVDKVIASVDAQRRVRSLTNLSDYLDQLLKKVMGQEEEVMTEEEYKTKLAAAETDEAKQLVEQEYQAGKSKGGIFKDIKLTDSYQQDTELINAISEAQSDVQASISSYQTKIITEGTTTTSKLIYTYTNDLINCANAYDVSGADVATENLVNIQNITQGVIGDAGAELDTITDGMLDQAFNIWKEKLAAGVSAEYKQAVAEGASEAAKKSLLTQQKTETNTAREEYQNLLEEVWKRMSNTKAQQDVENRISGIGDLEALVPADDAQSYQLETVAEHLSWLRTKLSDLVAESSNSSELDTLKKEKEDLEKQRQDALDKNDLASAKKLAAEIEAKQTDMDALTQELTNILNSDNSSEADKARALAGMTEGSTAKKLNSLASDIASGIRDGSGTSGTSGTSDTSGTSGSSSASAIENQMAAFSALSSYDPSAASAALSEIKDALENASDLDASLKDSLISEVENVENTIADASSSGSGSNLSASTLKELLADYFGEYTGNGSSNATSREKAGALIGLSLYAEETNNSDARALAAAMAGKMASEGNIYIYDQYDKDTTEYICLKALGQVLGYRYIFDNAHYTVTLSKGKNYYLFTNDSTDYTASQEKKSMKNAAGLMNTLYIPCTDAKYIFDATGYYVPKTTYASVRTTAMEPLIQEVYQMLMKGGT